MVLYCCAGWSLEFVVKFLLWNELIIDIWWLIYSTTLFLFYVQNIADSYFTICYGYYMVWSIIGILTTILGLYAVKKNKPSYLNGFLYYMYYYVIFESCCLIMLLLTPSLYLDTSHRSLQKLKFLLQLNTLQLKTVILIAAWYFLIIPNLIYFAIIVKRYRDKTIRSELNGTSDGDELSADYVTIKLFDSKRTSLTRITAV